jgi:2-polyprenyl-6-methoxyphenol hydroxylase-like FAD-dependent oxidoreductase
MQVLIVGGGPAGLVLAIELGRRGVPCILFEEDPGPPTFPKANASTSRTMEHYRRLGFVDEVRLLGLPDDYPLDVSYHTRFATHEIARLRWPSRWEARAARHRPDPRWPTPEPPHRGQQMFIEPVLKRHAGRWPSVDLRFGWQVEEIAQDEQAVRVRAREVATGRVSELKAAYAVGCDGPRSLVRETLGLRYQGIGSEDREFLGGRMLAAYVHAPGFYEIVNGGRSWQYWSINRSRCGVMVAIDGKERFVFHSQVPRGMQSSAVYAWESLELAAGRRFPYEILDTAEWTAGFTLVAERYGVGRIFIAGDAAHLFTPTAGQGYNTAVDDAANLGWKLAAVCQGWGSPALLSTYETERKPIGHRNTRFARSIADSFRRINLPEALESDSAEGEAARAEVGKRMQELAWGEFDAPGIQLGVDYGNSPIVANEPSDPPDDDLHRYVPHARPGARAPHLWLENGVALFDRFGRDFTLMKLDSKLDSAALENAARARGIPLSVLALENEEAQALYGRRLVLIRPDHHIAWRGDWLPESPNTLLDLAVSFHAG